MVLSLHPKLMLVYSYISIQAVYMCETERHTVIQYQNNVFISLAYYANSYKFS